MVNGAVYVQTNESSNKVVAFRRADDGVLSELGTYDTGGAGDAQPHLTSQGSVVLSSDGAYLLVTNAASDDVTVFAVASGGELERIGSTPVGPAPKSVTERGGLVYVLATGLPGVAGFRLRRPAGTPLRGSERGRPVPLRHRRRRRRETAPVNCWGASPTSATIPRTLVERRHVRPHCEVRPLDDGHFSVVLEVSELVWEPIAEADQ